VLGFYDEKEERLVNLTASSRVCNDQWFVAGVAEEDGRLLHVGWVKPWNAPDPHQMFDTPINTMSLVRVLSYDRRVESLVSNPAREYIKLRTASLFSRNNLSLPAGTPYLLPLPSKAGAAMDLEVAFALPIDADLSVSIQVLASPESSRGNATTLSLNVSGKVAADGSRQGVFELRTSREQPVRVQQNFPMAEGEDLLSLRVLVDRSIVEGFAAGGRAALHGRDYPAEGDTAVRLLSVGSGPALVRRLGAWSMGCGWESAQASSPPAAVNSVELIV